MPNEKGEPTLGEQFEDAAAYSDLVSDGGMDPRNRSEPHQVSEGMDALEAYRHLQKIEAEHAIFKDTIRYMAENAHQAYHQDHLGGWWDCPKNICTSAQQAIPDYALWLRGKGPKP
jgi:hypothetical protein